MEPCPPIGNTLSYARTWVCGEVLTRKVRSRRVLTLLRSHAKPHKKPRTSGTGLSLW